jgi:DnaJ-class molecular chaperone
MIKKIEDWTLYELLNVARTASRDEIRQAYLAAKETYMPGSLAAYSLVTEEERAFILGRIEEAFRTLSDQVKRKNYDLALLSDSLDRPPKVPFRQTTEKLEIEEAATRRRGFLSRLSRLFSRDDQ